MNKSYIIKKSAAPVALDAGWDSELWGGVEIAKLDHRYDRGGDFTPDVQVKMLYDDKRICGLFQVKDRYVVARAKANQEQVCLDSCVEFFVKPVNSERYYNFEFNCGGTMLLYSIINIREKNFFEVSEEDLATIERYHTMPKNIDPEITEPTTWYLGFAIPVEFFVKHANVDPVLSGQKWTGNFTKCADKCSHPCWLSWQVIDTFHNPSRFADISFE